MIRRDRIWQTECEFDDISSVFYIILIFNGKHLLHQCAAFWLIRWFLFFFFFKLLNSYFLSLSHLCVQGIDKKKKNDMMKCSTDKHFHLLCSHIFIVIVRIIYTKIYETKNKYWKKRKKKISSFFSDEQREQC